jgi:hypothetical protein
MDTTRFSDIRLETLPPLHVARCRAVSETPEEDAADRMARWRAAQKLSGPFRHFGFDTDVTPAEAAAGLRGYEVWTTVPAGVQPSGGINLSDFAGGLYAAMTIREPFDDPFAWIPAGWQQLHLWVEASPRVGSADHQWLEELVDEAGRRDLVLFHPVTIRIAEAQPA